VNQISKAIDGILVHANSYYKLRSLTTKIELVTTGLPYYALDKTYLATGDNLNLLRPIVQDFSKDADSYTILSFENNRGGTVGIAWGSTTCISAGYRGYKTNINEYMSDDMTTAATVVHEIGHNLGMNHDFGTQNDGYTNTGVTRYSSTNQKCSQVEGFMDYYGKTTKWSPCSVEDFTTYYNSVRTWCLPELSGTPTNPTTRQPTTKATTAKPTTKAPTPTCTDIFPSFCDNSWCDDFWGQYCKSTCKLC